MIPNLEWLDSQHQWMIELVVELCDINSGTYNLAGLEIVKERLVNEYRALDGAIRVLDIDPQPLVNDDGEHVQQTLGQLIHITKHDDAESKIMLCIHMDTVYPVNHPFQKCEMLTNGNLNGPGVADAKGGLVVMLAALLALERSPLAGKIGWEVIINPDEELGSPGSERFIHDRAPHCDWGLLFEPSLPDGTLVSWRKGTGNFTFVVRGREAHSGREFEKGRNAIVATARLMDQIDQLNTNSDITLNVGRISGGGPLNMVPHLAVGRVNIRVKTQEQQVMIESQLRDIVATFNSLDGIDVEMSGRFTSPPKILDAPAARLQARIESCAVALGQQVRWRGTGGACDGNKFAAAGLPNIDTLGPRGGDIHTRREYLIPESLVSSAKLAALTLLSFADSKISDPLPERLPLTDH